MQLALYSGGRDKLADKIITDCFIYFRNFLLVWLVDQLVSWLILIFFFLDRVSLHSPPCPGIYSAAQAGLEAFICLSSTGIKDVCYHLPAFSVNFLSFYFSFF